MAEALTCDFKNGKAAITPETAIQLGDGRE